MFPWRVSEIVWLLIRYGRLISRLSCLSVYETQDLYFTSSIKNWAETLQQVYATLHVNLYISLHIYHIIKLPLYDDEDNCYYYYYYTNNNNYPNTDYDWGFIE